MIKRLLSIFFKNETEVISDKMDDENYHIQQIEESQYEEDDYIIINDPEVIVAGLRNEKMVITEWHVNIDDFIEKGQKLFTISLPNRTDTLSKLSSNSPCTGVVLAKLGDNELLFPNQNCCVIRPLVGDELNELIFDLDIKLDSKSEESFKTVFNYSEVSRNIDKTTTFVTDSIDEFNGNKKLYSNVFIGAFGIDEMWVEFRFVEENSVNYIEIKLHKKHFKLSKFSVLKFLFSDDTLLELHIENDPIKTGKDKDGVLILNKSNISKEQIVNFANKKLIKWNLSFDNQEIRGGLKRTYYEYQYNTRRVILIARAFVEHV